MSLIHKNAKDKKINKDKKTIKDTYPISLNSQQCVGPCYYSNTKIIHPITLDEIKDVKHSFCPVNTFVYTDPRTKENELFIIDRCAVPTAHETLMDDMLRSNVIVPEFSFSSNYFVKVYYKISNLEDLLNWLDHHKTDPFKTKERVFNNSMVVYGDQLNIIDHRIVQFVNDLMIEYLPKLYRHLNKYISVKNNSVVLIEPNFSSDIDENKLDNNKLDKKHIALVRTYIKEKFLGSDNINQFMSKMIRYYKEDITDRYISHILVDHMIEYIIKRINLTLEQK